MKNYEDKIYSLGETVTGQTQDMSQAVQKTLENNGGVGIMTGSYDQNLSILSVNNLLLHSTGYTFDTFMEQTKGSLRNFFYDEEDILERDRFLQLHGTGEAQIPQQTVQQIMYSFVKRIRQMRQADRSGVMSITGQLGSCKIWHCSMRLSIPASGILTHDQKQRDCECKLGHEFRKMLGYHDTLDFPNKLESWSDLMHPHRIKKE